MEEITLEFLLENNKIYSPTKDEFHSYLSYNNE